MNEDYFYSPPSAHHPQYLELIHVINDLLCENDSQSLELAQRTSIMNRFQFTHQQTISELTLKMFF